MGILNTVFIRVAPDTVSSPG